MRVKVVFLGRLKDIVGAAEMEFAVGQIDDILKELGPDLAQAVSGPRIRLALNGALVNDSSKVVLSDGDELAFLPPVSGG